jgi:phosphatidylserine/phosphatidylglycerophosphate/cardiolipin synthase-like enzyme
LYLNVIGIPSERSSAAPHQKLVVIDGLLAFKGSANLTTTAWRKARKQHELIEVVTNPAEVMRLNNIYFSRSWLQWGRNRFKTVKDINRMDHM